MKPIRLSSNRTASCCKPLPKPACSMRRKPFCNFPCFGKGNVRACKIQDQPRYGWRGFMLDESRHFFGKEKVKQYLDIMASLRLNVFHWHLTDEPGWRIEIKRYPKLITEGSCRQLARPESARYVLHPGRDQGDRCLCSRSPHHGRSRIRHAGPCYCCLPFLS